jgi:hypothetical protein
MTSNILKRRGTIFYILLIIVHLLNQLYLMFTDFFSSGMNAWSAPGGSVALPNHKSWSPHFLKNVKTKLMNYFSVNVSVVLLMGKGYCFLLRLPYDTVVLKLKLKLAEILQMPTIAKYVIDIFFHPMCT